MGGGESAGEDSSRESGVLKAKAKQKAEEKQAAAELIRQRQEQAARTGKKVSGREPQVPDPEQAVPDPTTSNATSPTRSSPTSPWEPQGSSARGYVHIVVDGGSAGDRSGGGNTAEQRQKELVPMLEQVKQNIGGL